MIPRAVLFLVSLLCLCDKSLSSIIQDQNVSITINPPYVISKAVYDVDIECRVRHDRLHSLTSFFSMVISHSDSINQAAPEVLASVNIIDGHVHNISQFIRNFSATISNNGESFLRLTFKNSEANLTGQYQCDVSGFDNIGIPVTYYNTLKVQEISIPGIVNQLQTFRNQIQNLSQQIQTVNYQLQTCVTKPAVEHNTSKTCDEVMYVSSELYHGHRYCLSRRIVHTYQQGAFYCQDMDGYLVELDTHQEYVIVSDMVASRHLFATVYTGATDQLQEGVWINQHSSTLRPATEWEWGLGYPKGGTSNNCQCVSVRDGISSLIDCNCDVSGTDTYYYMCELF